MYNVGDWFSNELGGGGGGGGGGGEGAAMNHLPLLFCKSVYISEKLAMTYSKKICKNW